VGYCLCLVLHHRPVLHPRVHHAEIPATLGAPQWVEEQGETVSVHGADVHGYLLWNHGSLRVICDEPDASVVL